MAYALSQLHWPALAQDLAVVAASGSSTKDYSGILRTYGIKDAELAEIISVPKFKMLFEYAVKDCKTSDKTRSDVVERFSALSQSLAEKLYRDAQTGTMDSKEAVRLLELFLKAAAITDSKTAQVNTQVNVGLSLPLPTGLSNPKLNHLIPKEAQSV